MKLNVFIKKSNFLGKMKIFVLVAYGMLGSRLKTYLDNSGNKYSSEMISENLNSTILRTTYGKSLKITTDEILEDINKIL